MITTPRLRLRRCRQFDVDAVLAYRSRPDVAAHLSAEVWSRAKTERELAAYETAAFERAGDELVLLAELRETGEVVGEVGLVWIPHTVQTAEVGYVFDPAFGGKGYATEAVGALISAAFARLGFERVVATTDEDNSSSRALCERIGMRLQSASVSTDGRDIRECTYVLDRSREP